MTPPSASLQQSDYAFIRGLCYERAGLVIEEGKEYLVESRLAPLARREGCFSLDEFIGRLRGHSPNGLQRKAVEAMTINETSFFRDWRPFEALKKLIVPELLKKNAATRSLSIWSAASSSGQEAYSLAILLREYFPELGGWNLQIKGSDVSQEMVERAKTGRYQQLEVNRGMPAPLLVKHFLRTGLEWNVKDEVKRNVEFLHGNLTGEWPYLPRMDVVMLRNVMIYFDTEAKKKILSRMRQVLKPGGLLFLGAAETTLNLDPAYERLSAEGASYYRAPG